MQTLRVLKGGATSPQPTGPKIIAHICNDLGGWGKGFVLALSKRWPEPEKTFREWYRNRAANDFGLGAVQLVRVKPHTWVANMVGQRGTRTGSKGPPVRHEAIENCLKTLAEDAKRLEASVHMPRMGCGLAGGRWERIESIIAETLLREEVATTVYDFD